MSGSMWLVSSLGLFQEMKDFQDIFKKCIFLKIVFLITASLDYILKSDHRRKHLLFILLGGVSAISQVE